MITGAGSRALRARHLPGRLQHLAAGTDSRCRHHAAHQVSSIIYTQFTLHCHTLTNNYPARSIGRAND